MPACPCHIVVIVCYFCLRVCLLGIGELCAQWLYFAMVDPERPRLGNLSLETNNPELQLICVCFANLATQRCYGNVARGSPQKCSILANNKTKSNYGFPWIRFESAVVLVMGGPLTYEDICSKALKCKRKSGQV